MTRDEWWEEFGREMASLEYRPQLPPRPAKCPACLVEYPSQALAVRCDFWHRHPRFALEAMGAGTVYTLPANATPEHIRATYAQCKPGDTVVCSPFHREQIDCHYSFGTHQGSVKGSKP